MLLMLVGSGPLRESLERQAQEKGISDSVRFLGLRTDANRLIQMMDAMALPSLFEGFPTVALEWQCAGLPVLMSENITRQCAFTKLVRYLPLDADAWSDALLDLPATDRAAAGRSGVAALSAAGFDLDRVAAELENEYLNRLQN
jgi:glycosyltransferase involved in cell wall biosynthesis